MLCLLEASKVDDALALVTDLSDNLEDRTLEVRLYKEVYCWYTSSLTEGDVDVVRCTIT